MEHDASQEQPGPGSRPGDRGADGQDASASEIIGVEEAALDREIDAFGLETARASGPHDDVSLGGTGSHHLASYSDPLPAVAAEMAAADDTDGATGRRTPGSGSPEWMAHSSSQGGFGARFAPDGTTPAGERGAASDASPVPRRQPDESAET